MNGGRQAQADKMYSKDLFIWQRAKQVDVFHCPVLTFSRHLWGFYQDDPDLPPGGTLEGKLIRGGGVGSPVSSPVSV